MNDKLIIILIVFLAIAGLAAVLLHIWKGNDLISIFGASQSSSPFSALSCGVTGTFTSPNSPPYSHLN